MKTKTYSVAIVDDHQLFANILETLINTFENFHVLYYAKTGSEFLERLKDEKNIPDVVLMDINMPGMSGVDTMTIVNEKYPSIKAIALTMETDDETIVRMLQAGARGYLSKDIDPEVLKVSLREVAEKGFYYSERTREVLFSSIYNKKDSQPVVLKEREIEFLKQVCTEKTYKEIASEMFLSPKTIDGYREALFEKLSIKSRVGLAIYAIKNKFYNV